MIFLSLISNARSVWTDSGVSKRKRLGYVPCFTIRENTERPETIDFGTNILVSLEEGDFRRHFPSLHGENRRKTQQFGTVTPRKELQKLSSISVKKKIVKIWSGYQPNPPNYQIYRFSRHLSAVHLVLDSNYGILNPPF